LPAVADGAVFSFSPASASVIAGFIGSSCQAGSILIMAVG